MNDIPKSWNWSPDELDLDTEYVTIIKNDSNVLQDSKTHFVP